MAHIRPVDESRPHGPQRIDLKKTIGGEQFRKSYSAPTLAEAQILAARAELDLREGTHPDERYKVAERRAGMTVGEWIAVWRVDRALSPGTAVNERSHLDNHILPALGHLVLDDDYAGPDKLTPLRVQRWVDRLSADGYAPRTVKTVYGWFKTVVFAAIDEPSVPITASPFRRVRLPAVEPTGRGALEPEEVGAVLGGLRTHAELGWTLAFTGARVGELLARDVGDWSPLAGLSIPPGTRRGRADRAGGRAHGAKTPAGVRTIGFCGSHREMLRAYVGERRTGPLFLNRDRRRVGYDTFLKRFEEAAKAAGLPDVTPHWFRHTVITWLQEDGCNQLAIDEHVGHRTPGMRGVYGHVTPAMRAPILASLESRWRRARGLPAEGGDAAADAAR